MHRLDICDHHLGELRFLDNFNTFGVLTWTSSSKWGILWLEERWIVSTEAFWSIPLLRFSAWLLTITTKWISLWGIFRQILGNRKRVTCDLKHWFCMVRNNNGCRVNRETIETALWSNSQSVSGVCFAFFCSRWAAWCIIHDRTIPENTGQGNCISLAKGFFDKPVWYPHSDNLHSHMKLTQAIISHECDQQQHLIGESSMKRKNWNQVLIRPQPADSMPDMSWVKRNREAILVLCGVQLIAERWDVNEHGQTMTDHSWYGSQGSAIGGIDHSLKFFTDSWLVWYAHTLRQAVLLARRNLIANFGLGN